MLPRAGVITTAAKRLPGSSMTAGALGSLWLQPFRWRSIAWGLLFAVVYYAVLFPAGE